MIDFEIEKLWIDSQKYFSLSIFNPIIHKPTIEYFKKELENSWKLSDK